MPVTDRPYTILPPAGDPLSAPALADPAAALRESEAYFRSLVENARDVIHVINADRTTRYITPSVKRLVGYDAEELIGRNILDLLHPDDVAGLLDELRAARGVPATGLPLEVRVRHRNGEWRIFEGVGRNLLDDPVVRGVVINSRDVTDRRRRDDQIRRLASIPEQSPNPILECDLAGQPQYVNPAAERLIMDMRLDGPAELLPRDHEALVRRCVAQSAGIRHREVTVGPRVFTWTYHPQPSLNAVHVFGEEVTEQKRVEDRLIHQALHDPLTGLPNRHLFMERLTAALLRVRRREGGVCAVLFLDLDRFKVVNDSLGHHVGDELLNVVADRIRASVRLTDTVARFGGDEFAVLLDGLEAVEEATRIAGRVAESLAEPVALGDYELFTAASIGIALAESGRERPEDLLRNADMAMYRAKGSATLRCEVFDAEMHARAVERLELETDLRRALSRNEFSLVYQPIVSLRTGHMVGLEALLRWDHPTRGRISPADFVGVAEETGIILPLGVWVLNAACAQLAAWRREFRDARIALSVNLSAKQFGQRDLVEVIRAALADSGLDPRHLKLEITESAIIDNPGSAGAMLRQLKEFGIQVQMDDFGTGYSSLSSLHTLPLDGLKIDRSFVTRVPGEPATTQMVATIATLAHGLGLAVIAEGVETVEQMELVRSLDCEYAQGFLISPPLDPPGIRALLAEQRRW
ncbi:MAG TPA: EAL domain-containing protein [Longimicrobium sp.]|uniref:putative bifunctional diguanylate cyclase/phosphodiesterase n=1 Tax=Longimicrobium sp. TaxID=2029185 RepID=UPI002ED81F44